MKVKLFIFLILTIFVNVGYASFPIAENLNMKQDTSLTEEIEQYHSNLVKMGIDLKDCRCESCRKSNQLLQKDNVQHSSVIFLYILSGLMLLGVVIWLFIGLFRTYNCVNNRSNCPQLSGASPKRGFPIELAWMSLIILISVGVAIKARFLQIRSKRDVLKK